MSGGAYALEIRDPVRPGHPLVAHHCGVSGLEAARLMLQNADKMLRLQETGEPSAADLLALQGLQLIVSARLQSLFAPAR